MGAAVLANWLKQQLHLVFFAYFVYNFGILDVAQVLFYIQSRA